MNNKKWRREYLEDGGGSAGKLVENDKDMYEDQLVNCGRAGQ